MEDIVEALLQIAHSRGDEHETDVINAAAEALKKSMGAAQEVVEWQKINKLQKKHFLQADDVNYCTVCDYVGPFMAFGRKRRPQARCPNCNSLERSRAFSLVLERGGFLDGKHSILELAPSLAIAQRIAPKFASYMGVDIDAETIRAKGLPCVEFDLCNGDYDEIPKCDIILNSHVMEHVRCDPYDVIQMLTDRLTPRGVQVISVPLRGENTIEDMDPQMPLKVREERFGHVDHVRILGSVEFPERMKTLFGELYAEIDSTFFTGVDRRYSLAGLTNGDGTNRIFVTGPGVPKLVQRLRAYAGSQGKEAAVS